MNILIIEDDKLMRSGLSSILLDWGYTVSVANNGEEALKSLKLNNNIDLIMCDIFMPELSGPTFLLKLKSIFPSKWPQILVMSGVKDPLTFLNSLEVKYDAFISKPIDFNNLKNVLVNLLK